MSVSIGELKGGDDFDTIEVMSSDYDCRHVWLWPKKISSNDRIALSRDQLRQLRAIIDEVLAK